MADLVLQHIYYGSHLTAQLIILQTLSVPTIRLKVSRVRKCLRDIWSVKWKLEH
jgi:hypothetical protein